MERSSWWETSISDIEPGVIRYFGYPVEQLLSAEEMGFSSIVWLMTRGELPAPGQARLLERALIAGVDHGPQAPSIGIARMAMTCGIGINNAMSSATNVLGEIHGGAGQELMDIFRGIQSSSRSLKEAVEFEIVRLRNDKRHVPGFGHRFHPVDPRRDPLINAVDSARRQGIIDGETLRVALELERQLNVGREKPIPMNVDGATAVIYAELGFPPTLGRGLFVLSRSVGALAHAWEESRSGTRNKGPEDCSTLPNYVGPAPRNLVAPIDSLAAQRKTTE